MHKLLTNIAVHLIPGLGWINFFLSSSEEEYSKRLSKKYTDSLS